MRAGSLCIALVKVDHFALLNILVGSIGITLFPTTSISLFITIFPKISFVLVFIGFIVDGRADTLRCFRLQ